VSAAIASAATATAASAIASMQAETRTTGSSFDQMLLVALNRVAVVRRLKCGEFFLINSIRGNLRRFFQLATRYHELANLILVSLLTDSVLLGGQVRYRVISMLVFPRSIVAH
jgi:hypothetical protein